jgi:hypothetical protein
MTHSKAQTPPDNNILQRDVIPTTPRLHQRGEGSGVQHRSHVHLSETEQIKASCSRYTKTSVVIFQAQVRDQFLTFQMAQRVL